MPNALCVVRLASAAALPLAPEGWRLGLILFAGLSDFADGLIARRYGVASFLGAVLDVVSDKLFTLSAIATFWAAGVLEWWQAALLLSRDLTIMVVGAGVVIRRGWSGLRRMRPNLLGKTATLVLYTLFAALAAWPEAAAWAFAPAAVLSVAASLAYLRVFGRRPSMQESRVR